MKQQSTQSSRLHPPSQRRGVAVPHTKHGIVDEAPATHSAAERVSRTVHARTDGAGSAVLSRFQPALHAGVVDGVNDAAGRAATRATAWGGPSSRGTPPPLGNEPLWVD